jgi:tetratricopeptide (TPR) repeat protein
MRGRPRPAGDLGLDAEVDELEQAIRLSELDGGEGAALLNALAVALRRRYTAAGQRPDLERALDSARQAVAAAAAPSVHAVCLNTVGNCLADRFRLAGRRADLDAAIDAYRLAASEAPDPDDRRAFAANLAGAMADRFRFDGIGKASRSPVGCRPGQIMELAADSNRLAGVYKPAALPIAPRQHGHQKPSSFWPGAAQPPIVEFGRAELLRPGHRDDLEIFVRPYDVARLCL